MDSENIYGTKSIQIECVELLKRFHSFCVSRDIKYSIAYGTLLGAVRHGGFIPWDDDVDVILDRSNYFKLVEEIKSSNDLHLERISRDALWIDKVRLNESSYSGLYTPTIDVFIMDKCPEGVCGKIKLFTVYLLQGMIKYRLSLRKGSLIMKLFSLITFLIGRFFSHKKKYEWFHRISMWKNGDNSRYDECFNTIFSYISTKFPRGLLEDIGLVDFENIRVYAIENYDAFLKAQYGDYMTPPKDKRPLHLS